LLDVYFLRAFVDFFSFNCLLCLLTWDKVKKKINLQKRIKTKNDFIFLFCLFCSINSSLFSKNKIITCKTPKQKWNCVIIFDFYHKIENKNDASNTFIWKFSLVSFFLFFVLMKGCWGIQNFFFFERIFLSKEKKKWHMRLKW